MSEPIPFGDYLAKLERLGAHINPLEATPESALIRTAVASLESIPVLDREALTQWAAAHPRDIPVLGLLVGIGREKLKNGLKHRFDTAAWQTLARDHPDELIMWFDDEYALVASIAEQVHRQYNLADVLVARAGTRAAATAASRQGRRVEDEIESVVQQLHLPYKTRTRFAGRAGRTAPCDLVIPDAADAEIAVAAKGFDSTGSKLTDAVREIEEMAEIRTPRQFVIAVIDGIGWKNRVSDLHRIHDLWTSRQIDGMYTLATLDQFHDDVEEAARLRNLL